MIQTRVIAYRHATSSSIATTGADANTNADANANATHADADASITADADADADDATTTTTNITKDDKDDCHSGNSMSSSRNNCYCFRLEVTQKGQPIFNPTEDTVKGPIRLRLVSSTSPSSTSSSQSLSSS